ncbi:P-loop containing nucleoside triphosphate hydrolase protein [Apiospora marii]|uniref:P-loop containing nucleoside triphosphate hydrolase protein n=1 Tax=Apiospora marii TaxID=335849 RepID=A0ABR1S5S6_9PEZI
MPAASATSSTAVPPSTVTPASSMFEWVQSFRAWRQLKVPLIKVASTPDGRKQTRTDYVTGLEPLSSNAPVDEDLIVLEYLDKTGTQTGLRLEIRGNLRLRLQPIFDTSIRFNVNAYPMVFELPFHDLVFHADEIFALKTEGEEDMALEGLRFVMSRVLRDSIQTYQSCMAQNMINFKDLWTAYVPGELGVVKKAETEGLWQLLGTIKKDNEWSSSSRTARRWQFDGSAFGYEENDFKISHFAGSQPCANLAITPLRSLPEDEVRRIKLQCIEDGKKWFRLVSGHHHLQYDFLAMLEPPVETQWIDGRVVIDSNAFFRSSRTVKIQREGRIPRAEFEELPDNLALLCSTSLLGVLLDGDRWYNFFVRHLNEIAWTEGMWDSLDLESSTKDLLKVFVSQAHTSTDTLTRRGSGTVFLLHGPPGTGKTQTVKSLAEKYRLPLYRCSPSQWKDSSAISDIASPEYRFQYIFKLASSWKAIILMDEADSLVQKTTSKSAVLQAFLRQVEDYHGVAFLTSNIEHDIDEATRSRLTGLIRYRYPSGDRLKRAWTRSLQRFELGDAETEALARSLCLRYRPDFRTLDKTLSLAGTVSEITSRPITEELITQMLEFRGERTVQDEE